MDNHLTTSVTNPELDANSIAYALARNEVGERLDLRDALAAIGIHAATPAVQNLLRSAMFKAKYAGYVRELKESGESFKLKARVQAEELLKTQWAIIHDKDAPASVRMEGIKNVVEWADLKPKKNDSDKPQAPQITINIDLGGERPESIDVTPAAPQLESQ
jgi:hypothetical protein